MQVYNPFGLTTSIQTQSFSSMKVLLVMRLQQRTRGSGMLQVLPEAGPSLVAWREQRWLAREARPSKASSG